MNPYNGEILALASYPTYDPNEPPQARRGPGRALRPRHLGTVRARLGVQGDHALGGARNHQPRGRRRPSTAAAACSRCPGRIIHEAHARTTALSDGGGAGAVEQHRRHPDRHAGGRSENMYEYVRRFGFGAEDRASRCRANRAACSASWSAGARPRWLRSPWARRSATPAATGAGVLR